ncbi:complex I NDUFA9 subunit family protein [Croceicoccus mobilis]|uniref:3-beta-hydroxy-Delta(5)-steroid dehydrogenase n=1 Tax=Croceicoccus mobilis TaxID=1703339 RepID=A0A916YQR4_9SPHN|nr:complex I NDUFA9 subunit family protein [Croceicoccus mobilis]GGD57017.1 3-beta-hydroxy-Delta(5)-steroid dehydrogenase [Croceicoccus mobilis]
MTGLQNRLVTLVGGSGFFGKHVAQALLEQGARLRVASRHPEEAYSLRPLANLGQIQFARCDIRNEASLAAVIDGADAVVNLVGAFEGNLDAVMGAGAGQVAQIAADKGVSAFVHISAIGADANSAIDYQKYKGLGEQAVLAAFPKATVLRPSILFGSDDNFLNMFGQMISALPAIPVFAPQAKLQPLFVDDAADAVIAALADPAKHGGKTYEIAGPEVMTMLEINERIAEAEDRKRSFIALPDGVGRMIAGISGMLPGAPISSDQYAMLSAGNVASDDMPGIAKLGIAPRPLSLFLDRWMTRYRKHGRFGDKRVV